MNKTKDEKHYTEDIVFIDCKTASTITSACGCEREKRGYRPRAITETRITQALYDVTATSRSLYHDMKKDLFLRDRAKTSPFFCPLQYIRDFWSLTFYTTFILNPISYIAYIVQNYNIVHKADERVWIRKAYFFGLIWCLQ